MNYLYILIIIQFFPYNILGVQLQKNKPIGKVTLPLGIVTIQPIESLDWSKAKVNQSVYINDKVKTHEKSRCEITLQPKKIFRIGEGSNIIIGPTKDGSNMFSLETGHAWLNISSVKRGSMQIRTPTAVAAIRGTIFKIDCNVNHAIFSVYTGSVDVTPIKKDGLTMEDTTFVVEAGNVFTIINDFEKYLDYKYKEMEQFIEQDKSDFDKFYDKQYREFQNTINAEKNAFKLYKSQSYMHEKFDLDEDDKSDWIKWNKERDLLLD